MQNNKIKSCRLKKINELEVFVFHMQKQFIGFSKVHQIQESITSESAAYTQTIFTISIHLFRCVFST